MQGACSKRRGVHAFILCPDFTHKAIARIVDVVGEGVSVNVARGDGPSNEAALKIMREIGWFEKRTTLCSRQKA
ncbi:hypothetical protein H5T51_04670 [Candidatus Bathyarchaeota archaeon]|nr:hypothetical protein [Candidatus Bathyarchaeota archaeon]